MVVRTIQPHMRLLKELEAPDLIEIPTSLDAKDISSKLAASALIAVGFAVIDLSGYKAQAEQEQGAAAQLAIRIFYALIPAVLGIASALVIFTLCLGAVPRSFEDSFQYLLMIVIYLWLSDFKTFQVTLSGLEGTFKVSFGPAEAPSRCQSARRTAWEALKCCRRRAFTFADGAIGAGDGEVRIELIGGGKSSCEPGP